LPTPIGSGKFQISSRLVHWRVLLVSRVRHDAILDLQEHLACKRGQLATMNVRNHRPRRNAQFRRKPLGEQRLAANQFVPSGDSIQQQAPVLDFRLFVNFTVNFQFTPAESSFSD